MPLTYDPYAVTKALNIYREIANHEFQNVNAAEIVARIMKGRAMYEERQRKKGEKGIGSGEIEAGDGEGAKEEGG
jgi:ethanolamine-phosphate cytidylyltransferase